MAAIDPTTSIGKIRLRVGDFTDLEIFPDTVYQSVLDDCDDNIVRASQLAAQYVLATLTMRVHEKMAQVEVYGHQYVDNYIKFLKATILNPHLMQVAPIPYMSGEDDEHPLLKFREDWNNNYAAGTASDQLSLTALGSSDNGFF